MEFSHIPIMLNECLEGLAIRSGGLYLDGTAGGAGHSREIAKRLEGGRLYAMDQDPDAIEAATARLSGLPATVIQGNFRNAKALLTQRGVDHLDGALLDLGVSSHQLDDRERGFSYLGDAPLDMRMSQSGPTAADLVNSLDRDALGPDPAGVRGGALCLAGRRQDRHRPARRRRSPPPASWPRSVAAAMPPAVRRKDKNPARRSFQAIRIAVNGELDALSEGLDGIFDLLAPGGRFCIITFHSLEDRLVKQRFRRWCTACTCPPEFPVCVCGGVAKAKQITHKPLQADSREQQENRRSRSAKLRIIEKL